MARQWHQAPRYLLVALALFGLVSHLLLNLGLTVPALLLPGLLLPALALLLRRREEGIPVGRPRGWRLGLTCFWAILIGCLVPMVIATLAGFTPSVDGYVAWQPRTRFLALTGSLDHPAFTDFRVFCHSRPYALLQPLILSTGQRLLGDQAGNLAILAVWLLLIGLTWQGCRRRGLGHWPSLVATLSLALTPMLVTPGAGAIDSGYGDFMLLTLLTAVALGLVLEDPLQLGAALLLLPMTKPEGMVYGFIVCFAAWALAPRRICLAATIAFALGLQLWLPLHFSLAQEGPAPGFTLFTPWLAGALAGALLTKEILLRLRLRPWPLALTLGGAAALILVTIHLQRPLLGSRGGPLFGVFLAHFDRIWGNLGRLPEILGSWVTMATFVRKYGLVFILMAALALTPRRLAGPCPSRPLALLLGLAALVTVVPFLVVEEDRLAHHLRSRMDRLFLHWVGAVWVLFSTWFLPAATREGLPSGDGRDASIPDPAGRG